jgi:CheY-like chemotaxis protein
MGRLDALRELRAIPELQHIPVIARSAAASEQERQRGVPAGFHTSLTKPLNVDALIEQLQQLLERASSRLIQ